MLIGQAAEFIWSGLRMDLESFLTRAVIPRERPRGT
jgi:hypothetical protein